MNKNSTCLPILPTLQSLLDKPPTILKLPKQILILDIVNFNVQVLILLPVLEVLKVIFQDRDYVRDSCVLKGGSAP